MLLAGCMVPTAGSEAMERIMLWQITNLQQGGCATYLNGTSLLHRLTEHCIALSTAGETVITNVTIETIGEAKMHSHVHAPHVRVSQPLYCGVFPSAHATKHLERSHVFACSSTGFDEIGAWIRTSNSSSYTRVIVSIGNGTA